MTKNTYEMQWDCQFCGTKKLPGKTHRFCPHCGAPQNPDSRYYPSDEEKVAVENHVYIGRDRICASCNELNSAASEFCQQCGASLENAAEANVLEAEKMPDSGRFESSGSRDLVQEKFDAEMARVGGRKKKKNGSRAWNIGLIAGMILFFVLLAGAIYMFTATEEADLQVTGHTWSRSVAIDIYKNDTVSGWHDSGVHHQLDNAVRQGCELKQRGTIKVPYEECHIERVEKGDGTYEEIEVCETKYRREPNYENWCTWSGQRWSPYRAVPTSGNSVDETPYWGETRLKCEGRRRIGCERVNSRYERYTVLYIGNNHDYTCDFPQNTWQSIPVDSWWTGQVGKFVRGTLDCDSLKRK